MKLAYFVHDLSDPAVARRVSMLRAGGAEPVVLGFRRTPAAPEAVAGAPAVDLGRTHDARLGHRAAATALAAIGSGRLKAALAGVEIILARSLEMLAVAQAARRTCGLGGRLVYECLDIHRLMVSPGVKGRALRAVERRLIRTADLLVVSSPAFLEAYFEPRQGLGQDLQVPALLVENKVLELQPTAPISPVGPPAGPPWRIAWLGAIRCRRSLDILTALASRRPDLVEISIHGRPAYTEFADFEGQVAGRVTFGGAYTAAELPALYGQAHFAWAIDYMEEGLNSSWLLPNRIYEASRYGAVPIALAEVETGRFLARRAYGVRLADPAELEAVLDGLTPEAYGRLKRDLEAVPASQFRADEADCRRLVEALGGNPAMQDEAEPSTAKLVA